MNIGLDMMGGDYAPLEAIKGIKLYRESGASANLTLFGDSQQIDTLLKDNSIDLAGIQVVHTSQVVDMDEHPTKALREKQDSSIAVGFGYLAKGITDAFISAGNTGAMMVGSLFSIKAIEGIQRPTIGAYMPRENGKLGCRHLLAKSFMWHCHVFVCL